MIALGDIVDVGPLIVGFALIIDLFCLFGSSHADMDLLSRVNSELRNLYTKSVVTRIRFSGFSRVFLREQAKLKIRDEQGNDGLHNEQQQTMIHTQPPIKASNFLVKALCTTNLNLLLIRPFPLSFIFSCFSTGLFTNRRVLHTPEIRT